MTALKTYIVSAILAIVFNAQDTLWATPNHPFWHKGHYVEASALHAGDTIETLEGAYDRIQQIIPFSEERQVYNFTVAENSNYYVGSRGILVHNDCFLKRLTDSPELIARIDALPDALKGQFIQDFYEAGEDVIKVLKEKVGCVKAWEVVSNLPVDKLWVRRNVDLLEKMSHLDVVDQNLVNLFYTTFKPSKFPKVPPCVVNGIQFNKYGFPDFRTSAPNMPDGSRSVFNAADHPNGFLSGAADDMTAANNWALNRCGSDNFRRIPGSTKCEIKIGDEWVEHTWHHFEDGRNMFPVPSSVHSSVQHTGGASVIDKSLEDFFDPLSF